VADPVPILLPKWGMNMVEATIVAWLKAVGERVETGEPLVSVETDKVEATVEAPASGVLSKIVAQPDDDVPVGATLGFLEPDP
jgi:pyruvate dehydrogenase E2 component (dihydrolipoyllysine-residue acetyltransferase)